LSRRELRQSFNREIELRKRYRGKGAISPRKKRNKEGRKKDLTEKDCQTRKSLSVEIVIKAGTRGIPHRIEGTQGTSTSL